MIRFRLLCSDFLLPNPAPHLENRMTVCMGYPGWPRKGEPENAAGRGYEIHAGRTAHSISTGQNGQLKKPDELTGRDSQIFACQLARSKSAEDAVLCPSDMMLCVISYWVLSGAKWRQIQQFCCFVLSRKDVETEIRKIIYSQIIYI